MSLFHGLPFLNIKLAVALLVAASLFTIINIAPSPAISSLLLPSTSLLMIVEYRQVTADPKERRRESDI